MTRRRWPTVLLVLCVFVVPRQTAVAQPPAVITILHLNDVYEIEPIEGGHEGGLSRVATVLKQLKRTQAPVLSVLAGDYLSPSAIGTAIIDGQPLAGRQMVDVLNATGIDWATFGNHEFDVSQQDFQARNAQSRFHLVTSNVTDLNGQLFPNTVRTAIVPIRAGGRVVRLGLFGLTIDSNRQPWMRYAPPIASARSAVEELRGKVDCVIAITHQSIADDQELVTEVEGIDVVLGGHEHENWYVKRGPAFTPIIKADANVRTIAIVTLTFARRGAKPLVSSRLQVLDDSIPQDAAVEAVARRWTTAAFDAFRNSGFMPERVVATTTETLDGRASTVRNHPGRLTDLITAAFARDAGGVDVSILNGGSVRIDDEIPAGPVTEYDIIRILPFGGRVARATFDGSLLASVLDTGRQNVGIGGFLHTRGVTRQGDRWVVGAAPLDPKARYRVALTDFLLSGSETNLGFLTEANPGIHDVEYLRDVRHALIDEIRTEYLASK